MKRKLKTKKKPEKKTAKRAKKIPEKTPPLPDPPETKAESPPEVKEKALARKRGEIRIKRARFIDEYMKDLNATQAYIRAGYKPKTRAEAQSSSSRLLSNAIVKAEIERRQWILSERCQVSAEAIVKELWLIGRARISDVASWTYATSINDTLFRIKDSDEMSDDEMASISTIEETKIKDGRKLKVKLNDRVSALELLARHLGMLTPKPEKTDPREDAAKWRQMIQEMDDATFASPATAN
jgi:phage terminase small subunit